MKSKLGNTLKLLLPARFRVRLKQFYLDNKERNIKNTYGSIYQYWIRHIEKHRVIKDNFSLKPLISVLIPDIPSEKLLNSLQKQSYKNFEILCCKSDFTRSNGLILRQFSLKGNRSEILNQEIEKANGQYCMVLEAFDQLSANAFSEMVYALNDNHSAGIIYSDDDVINYEDYRSDPFFKPDWSPETLLSWNYIGNHYLFKKNIALNIGKYDPALPEAAEYDLALRIALKHISIIHIPQIICHIYGKRADYAASAVENKLVKEKYISLCSIKASLEPVLYTNEWRFIYDVDKSKTCVSVIIPSKDNPTILQTCISTLIKGTNCNYEIIVVDNGSNNHNKKIISDFLEKNNVRYIYNPCDFNFSYMCNLGAKYAHGNLLLFLNDDIEIPEMNNDWMTRLAGQALQDDIGIVGGKLLFPGGNLIQHAGVKVMEYGIHNAFGGMSDSIPRYYGRNRLEYNWIAVTGACLMVKKFVFETLRGFDEQLPVNFNDVDLGMKCLEYGYRNVVRQDVTLIHHESISRGNDDNDEAKHKKLLSDLEYLYTKHPKYRKSDPYYNINLDQMSKDYIIRTR